MGDPEKKYRVYGGEQLLVTTGVCRRLDYSLYLFNFEGLLYQKSLTHILDDQSTIAVTNKYKGTSLHPDVSPCLKTWR